MWKTKEKVYAFNSCFAPLLHYYYEQYRAIGNTNVSTPVYLEQFDRFCLEKDINNPLLTKEIYEEWTAKRSYETDRTHHQRTRILRSFATYLANNGHEAYISFHKMPRLKDSYIPYIFSDAEIERIFIAVDHIPRSAYSPKSHLLMSLLIRMLYCCGLRISEALSLEKRDIDLATGIITIRKAKNGKERFVPMSGSLLIACLKYHTDTQLEQNDSIYFFPSLDKGRYANCTIYTRFRKILWLAGISHGGRGKGPRLHDFRHTFAVHTLREWVKQGKDVYVLLPTLSRYLGHDSINITECYLRLTPEIYPELTASFERSFGTVFPEVCYEEL